MRTLLLLALSLVIAPPIAFAQNAQPTKQPPTKIVSGRSEDIAKVKEMIDKLSEIQFEIKSRTIRCRMAQLEVESAKLAEAQLALRIKHAENRGEREEVELLTLERQQLALRTDACKLELELATLELERANTAKERLKSPHVDNSSIKHPVQIEYIDELGVIILRGAKEDVKKLQQVIEKIDK